MIDVTAMREIKFRGRRKNSTEWAYGAFLAIPKLCSYIYDVQPDGQATRYLVDEDTVGQFTGLLDSNGKEIYEGDIVKANLKDKSFVKRFHMSENVVGKISFDGAWWLGEWDALWRLPRYYDLTVIGNIHDNPNLLEADDARD